MRELPPDASDLLARARREQPSPDGATRARVKQRVAAAVAAGMVASTPTHAVASTAGKSFTSLPVAAKFAGVAMLVAIGTAGSALLSKPSQRPRGASTHAPITAQLGAEVASDAPAPTTVPSGSGEPLLPRATEPAPASEPPPPVASARRASHGARDARASGQLRAELALLDGASQAIARADAQEARRLLEQHRASFAHPVLREERQGLELIARCMLDREAALPDVEAFLARAGRAVLRARVERACRRSPP